MNKLNKVFRLFTLFTFLTNTMVFAVIPEKHPTDQFQIGKSSTSNDKQLLFDLGLGASNPSLACDSSDNLKWNYNKFLMGDAGNSTNKSFVANIGNGVTNPSIVWNHSTNQWQFSNNGSTFLAIGSSSGGGKNYLSNIITSNGSGNANTGNGNFELSSTTGWSLAHSALSGVTPTSTASAGSAFSSSVGGSPANGNLSLTLISSGQIEGNYSGDLASSSSSTAGDMLISDAFYIDSEDKAKMLQFQFYYNANSGAANLNFSGTSSNSYAIWIYDVTNGQWLMPQGVYNLVQSSGTGYAVGTFQTTINSTQYQLALININASSGAFGLYVDSFLTGPQIAPMGPSMSDWASYTPTVTGVTSSGNLGYFRRVGDTIECQVLINVTGSSSAAITASIPSQFTMDTSKLTSSVSLVQSLGSAQNYNGSTANWSAEVVANDTSSVKFIGSGAATSGVWGGTAPSAWSSGGYISAIFSFPATGLSSNTVQSSSTDTRVLAANVVNATATVTGSYSNITWTTIQSDNYAGFNGSSSVTTYTAPVTGYYDFSGQVYVSATTIAAGNNFTISLFNSSSSSTLYETSYVYQGTNTTSEAIPFNYKSVYLNAGTGINIQIKSNTSSPVVTSSATQNFWAINRQSGPAVISASESVNGLYTDTSSASITTSIATFSFSTKVKDTHNAYSAGTLTIPVSGMYTFTAQYSASTSLTTGQAILIFIYRNGSQIAETIIYGNGAASTYSPLTSLSYPCSAGDTIQVKTQASISTNASGSAGFNNFSWARVGN